MSKNKILICPYCGETQPVGERCVACTGLFEPLSRQATHNAMGPWFVRNPFRPFQPGCSYETLVKMVERGQVIRTTIVRGPTSKQFWTAARRLPGIAHLLGYCHNCDASVDPGDHGCHSCGVPFGAYLDRNYLGLPEVKPLPWEAPLVDDRGGAGGMRGMDWQRAAEPMGISSFGSDRELRAAAGASKSPSYFSGGTGSGPSSHGSGSAAIMEPVSSAVGFAPAAAVESATGSAAYRALQRRMQQQRNTIRMLIVGLVALAVLAVLAVAAKLASSTGPTAATRLEAVNPAPSIATAPATAQAASLPSYDAREDLRRVDELIAQAQDEGRSIGARVADYEQAQMLLKEISGKLPPDQQPADLVKKRQTVQHELEQLKLKQYFP